MMEFRVVQLFERIKSEQLIADKRKRSIITVSLLAFVVLLAVSFALVPAFGTERILVCEKEEHIHGEECFAMEQIPDALRLACGANAHRHTENCLDDKGVVVCGKSDYLIHTHNEYCYAGEELVCVFTEHTGESHAHTDSCRDENGVLVCGKTELSEHNHTAQCVDSNLPTEKSVLVCEKEEHSHEGDCWKTVSKGEVSQTSITSESDTEDKQAYVSAGDTSSSDVYEQEQLLESLVIAVAPEKLGEGENVLGIGESAEYAIEGKSTTEFIFTPSYTHGYTIKIIPTNGYLYYYIYDSNETQVFYISSSSTVSTTLSFNADETYTIKVQNSASTQRGVKFTVQEADSYHVFEDGECVCGLREDELGGSCGSNVSWSFSDGVLTISGSGAMAYYSKSTDVPWNNIASSIKEVVISDGITSICNYAFNGCSSLESIDISKTVTSIGSYAFNGCSSLESVDIPEAVTSIGSYAFYGCSSLKSVDIPENVTSLGSYAFYGCSSLESIDIPDGVKTINSGTFSYCSSLTEVNIGENSQITSIGDGAFRNCTSLTNFEIPEKVTAIGSNAFSGCTSLESIDIPDSVKTINSSAFYQCSALSEVNFGENSVLDLIGTSAFRECTSLESVSIPDSVTKIYTGAFRNCTSLADVTFGSESKLQQIGDSAFRECTALESITIPDSVTEIDDYAFYYCSKLADVNISQSSSLSTLGGYTFAYCTELDSVYIPSEITAIDEYSFNNCQKLTEVVFAEDIVIESIGTSAFYGCDSLVDITIPDSVTNIGLYAFYSCDLLESVDLPVNLESIGGNAFAYCYKLSDIELPEGLLTIDDRAFSSCRGLESIHIPGSVTSLGNYAFQSCTNLEEVTFDEDITIDTLGNYQFDSCTALKSIDIPDSVTAIGGQFTFGRCTSLESITIPDSVIVINNSAFSGCTSLKEVIYGEDTQMSNMGSSAFNGCTSLEMIYLPKALTSIGQSAFTAVEGSHVYIDSAELESIHSAAIKYPEKVRKVTIGDNVEVVTDAVITMIGRFTSIGELCFAPENYVSFESDVTVPCMGKTIEKGDYYADANGVLYRLDKENGTAVLYHLPDEYESFTLPVYIPAEDGSEYTVNGVSSLAIIDCTKLSEFNFTDAGIITVLPSGALSNCPTLESVNGATTVDDAYALFTNGDYIKYDYVFYDTGLEENSGKTDEEIVIYGNDTDLIPIVRVAIKRNEGTGDESLRDTLTYYTNEAAQIMFAVSNSNAIEYDAIRIYFAFDSEQHQLSWPLGDYKVESDGGTIYTLKVVQSSVDKVYYIECPRIEEGDTLFANLTAMFPSPNSPGGKLRVWPATLTAAELTSVGKGVAYSDKYNELEWITRPDDFTVSKGVYSSSTSKIITLDENGVPRLYNLTYSVNFNRLGDTLLGIGKDYVKSVDYYDVMTLPEGLEWDSRVVESIKNGDYTVTAGGGVQTPNVTIKVNVDGVMSEFCRIANKDYSISTELSADSVSVGMTDDNQLILKWTLKNIKYDQQEITSGEMSIFFYRGTYEGGSTSTYMFESGYQYTPTYIIATDPQPGDVYNIHNEVTATEHFCYSQDQNDFSQVDASVAIGAADFKFKKSVSSSNYWGAYRTATIYIYNDGVAAYPGIDCVTDSLNANDLYIKPGNIQAMFDDFTAIHEARGGMESMTVTITNATLCTDSAEAGSPYSQVVATDGSMHTLVHNNSGAGTQYSGCETDDPSEYNRDATIVITCTADGRQTLTCGDKVLDASDVSAALEAIGYTVTPESDYSVMWDFTDDFILNGGEKLTFYSYGTWKDTFMRIADDMPNYKKEDYIWSSNSSAYAYYYDSQGKRISKIGSYGSNSIVYRDFKLFKDAVINGDSRLSNVVDGDVIDYTLTVNKIHGDSYDVLPLTDHMTGAQVLLAAVDANGHLAQYAFPVKEIDGVSYYCINKPGVYKSVDFGGRIADNVTITQINGGGFDTRIHWYLHDIVAVNGSYTKTLTFKALVDTVSTNEYDIQYALDNECWLNDHQTHRLWDSIGGEGEGYIGTGLHFSKYIVLEKGESPNDDLLAVYEPFREGEDTEYRLMLRAIGDSVTLSGDDIYDMLPLTNHDAFKWSKDNISLYYQPDEGSTFSFTGVDGDDETWYIDSVTPEWMGIEEHEDQLYIRWSKDMQLTINGTLYIYVTLELPEGAVWLDNAVKYRETRLENSFYVRENRMTVGHDLITDTEAYLQKGVYETTAFGYKPSNMNKDDGSARTNEDSRHFYFNSIDIKSRPMTSVVKYYATLYNSGTTRLYLNALQDALPKGVTMFEGSNKKQNVINFTGDLNLADENGNELAPVWKQPEISYEYDIEKNLIHIDLAGGDLSYDPLFDMYYLAPNEGIKLLYYACIGESAETDDSLVNTIAMPYFDYLGEGVNVSNDSISLVDHLGGVDLNDGECRIMDTAQANLIGIEGGNIATRWLASDVVLNRGEIVPGITKWVNSITRSNGTVVTDTETAGTEDTVNWTVKMTNSGYEHMPDYTFTDVVDADYGFTGTVTVDLNADTHSYESVVAQEDLTLFNIIRDRDDPDSIVFEYKHSNYYSTTPTKISYTRGDAAVHITQKQYQNFYMIFDIWVRIYVNDDGKEVLEIRFDGELPILLAGGSSAVSLSTINLGTWQNKVYYNNAYITPNDQTYNAERVSQGNHLLFGDESKPSVKNSAQITATYGYVTSSEKRIREIGNEQNCASSKDEKNWIFLDEHDDTFRYTNLVNNITGKSLSKFVMIDNLPEIGDHATFAITEERYSEFKVELLSDPDFEVAIVNGSSKTVLDDDQYELMFSDRTEFRETDWDDSNDEGWYNSVKNTTRSFRISIYDDTGLLIPDKAVIQVEYNGRIIMKDTYSDDDVNVDPEEGEIAWNSFGYHYRVLGEPMSLEAAPLKVGVCIQYIPLLEKNLVYPDGSEYITDKDETFRFLLYSGEQISGLAGKNDSEIFAELSNAGRMATVVQVTVPAGSGRSETIRLSDLRVMNYDAVPGEWLETDEEWCFVDGESFTILEIDNRTDMYDIKMVGTSVSGSYSSKYNGQKLISIEATNQRKSWQVRLNKVDSEQGKVLAGAVFGIYSPVESEQISAEDYAALDLTKAPAMTVRHDGTVWYLMETAESGTNGEAIFKGLIEDKYLVRELQAPGGYKLKGDTWMFALSDAENFEIVETISNESDYELPRTGTDDAAKNMILGNILMLAAAAVLVLRKRICIGQKR